MNWFIYALLATVTFAFATVLQKVLLEKEAGDPVAFAAVFQFVTAIIILPLALKDNFVLPAFGGLWLNLILMTVLYAFANIFLFKGLKLIEASQAGVLGATRSFWTIISAVIFLGEGLSFWHFGGAFLIIFGTVIVTIEKKHWRLSRGHLYALLAAIFFGLAFTNDAFLLGDFTSVPVYGFISFLLPSLVILLVQPKVIQGVKYYLVGNNLFKISLCAFVYAVAYISTFTAYQQGGQASQIAPIVQSSVILIVLFAYLFLGERQRFLRKTLAATFAFIGILLLR